MQWFVSRSIRASATTSGQTIARDRRVKQQIILIYHVMNVDMTQTIRLIYSVERASRSDVSGLYGLISARAIAWGINELTGPTARWCHRAISSHCWRLHWNGLNSMRFYFAFMNWRKTKLKRIIIDTPNYSTINTIGYW